MVVLILVLVCVVDLDGVVVDSTSSEGVVFAWPDFFTGEPWFSASFCDGLEEVVVFKRWDGLSFCSSVSSSELSLRRLDAVVDCLEKLRRVCLAILMDDRRVTELR